MDQRAVDPRYWCQDAPELMRKLGSGPTGLSATEAAARLETVGPNTIEIPPQIGTIRLFLRQFESPLVLILFVAAAISLLLRSWGDAAIILAIMFGSSLLSFLQEYRASEAMDKLKRQLELKITVMRDGSEQKVPLRSIVPGDLVMLSAGNLVPADGVIVEAEDFLVSEASMTGESFPVEKRPGTVPPDAPITARTNSVFLGASVRSGTAKVLAVETGRRTEFGEIAAMLAARPPESDFARGLRRFGNLLIRLMILIVLAVLTANLLLGRPAVDSLMFAAALAVGISPEMLPAITSVTLSSGARAMSRRGVLVKRLDAIEDLGAIDILCTDKTGTLTEGKMVLRDVQDSEGRNSVELLHLAYLNAAFETGIENPLDAAIVAAGTTAGHTTSGTLKVDEIPYDFLRRSLTIVVAEDNRPDEHFMVTKGAVSNVLEICTEIERGGTTTPLDAQQRADILARFEERSKEGLRVLALASRRIKAKDQYERADEAQMSFRGLLLFHAPPKPDAAAVIQELRQLGITVKVISGDNRYVTAYLAKVTGLNAGSMLTGEQLSKLNDEALWHLAPRTDLFVEIDPQQKERIVYALQRTGHAVGYLGDGINDAPALHTADVGISVADAADVARESADIVLLTPDLETLRLGVEDGRRTFSNILKYISITTSANFGNMVSMALATPFLPFLPLSAKQILLNNFLSDFPSVAMSTDKVDAEDIAKARRWDIQEIRRFMVVFGLVSSAFDILTFLVLLRFIHADQSTFQTSWFLISLLTELAVVLVLRTRRPAHRSRPSSLLLWSTLVVIGLALSIPYLWPLNAILGFVPLPLPELAVVTLVVAGYIAATEGTKIWFYRRRRHAT